MTCAEGKSCLTAIAIRWAVEWRIIERASSERSVSIDTLASTSIRYDESTSQPSTTPAIVALARPGPISPATSITDTGASKDRCEPSGRVIRGIKESFSVVTPTKGHMIYLFKAAFYSLRTQLQGLVGAF